MYIMLTFGFEKTTLLHKMRNFNNILMDENCVDYIKKLFL